MDNILENNKLIARFMGREVHTDGIGWFDEKFKTFTYQKGWNELMPVIEKIINTEVAKDRFTVDIYFDINNSYCTISRWYLGHVQDRTFIGTSSKAINVLATYKAVVEFIKWYNNNNK